MDNVDLKQNEVAVDQSIQIMEKWRMILFKLDARTIKPEDQPVHAYLKFWVGTPSWGEINNKQKLIEAIAEDPEAADEIQGVAQNLYKSKNIKNVRLFRGERKVLGKDKLEISGWSSLTENKEFAQTSANPNANFGWKEGVVLEFDVPVENIFTYYKAHPAFKAHQPEMEFILNENGLTNAKLISIDGQRPTNEELDIVKSQLPIDPTTPSSN